VLAKLLPVFRLGLGGPLGRPSAWWSWVALDDVVGAIVRAIDDPRIDGPVNLVAPHPVTVAEFSGTLGRALSRPAVLPVPAPVLRVALGEMADETVLASARVLPRRAMALGIPFRWPSLGPALEHALGTRASAPG
jgi:uncharacterized protein